MVSTCGMCWRVHVGKSSSVFLILQEPQRLVEAEPDVMRLPLQPGDSYVVLGRCG